LIGHHDEWHGKVFRILQLLQLLQLRFSSHQEQSNDWVHGSHGYVSPLFGGLGSDLSRAKDQAGEPYEDGQEASETHRQ
jgi:hypothetical protein